MPYISPKMATNTRIDEEVIGLSDVLAGTSLAHSSVRLVGADSSSSVDTLSSASEFVSGAAESSSPSTSSSTSTSTSTASTRPSTSASSSPETPDDIPAAPPMHSDALEQYSRSVYAFTMGLYTAAQVKDLRRNKGSKSYSFTTPKRPTTSA